MKHSLLIAFCTLTVGVSAQDIVSKKYSNHFGSKIEFYPDSSFRYQWRYNLSSSWSKGKWKVYKDTVFLAVVPVYDTLRSRNTSGVVIDSLIVSPDEKSEQITQQEAASFSILLGGQNWTSCPDRLYYKDQKLFNIWKGQIVKRRERGTLRKNKYYTWYSAE